VSVKKDGILEANFMKKHKNCQSCGMPFSKDENGGGTEKMEKKVQRIAVIAMKMKNSPFRILQ